MTLCDPLPIDRDKLCFSVRLCVTDNKELTQRYTKETQSTQRKKI